MISGGEWFRYLAPRPEARVRLFCVPYAGSGAMAYRSWAAAVDECVELVVVQLPGREDRWQEPVPTRFADLIGDVIDAVPPHLDMPHAWYGHSLGALVAFEVVRALRETDAPEPACLLVSGCGAPQLRRPRPETAGEHDDAIVARVLALGGTHAEILADPEMRAFLLPVLRNDLVLADNYEYRPGPLLTTPMTAWCGSADPLTSVAEMAAWSELTLGDFRLDVLPGDHFFIQTERPSILAALATALTRVGAALGG